MKKFVAVTFAFALIFNVSGCGAPKGDAEMKEMIKSTTEMVEAVESKDPKKMIDATAKVGAAAKKLDDLKLTDAEKKKLEDKYKPEMDKLQDRLKKAGATGM